MEVKNMFFSLLVISFGLFELVDSEYFSSMAQLRQAVEYVEKSEITKYVANFIQEQRSNLMYIREVQEDLTKLQNISEIISVDIDHPVCAFRRLQIMVETQLQGDKNLSARVDEPFNKSRILEYMSLLPTEGDLEGSAVGK